jgi:hypothetical protein
LGNRPFFFLYTFFLNLKKIKKKRLVWKLKQVRT